MFGHHRIKILKHCQVQMYGRKETLITAHCLVCRKDIDELVLHYQVMPNQLIVDIDEIKEAIYG